MEKGSTFSRDVPPNMNGYHQIKKKELYDVKYS